MGLNNNCLFLWHITTDCDSIELLSFCCFWKPCRISFFSSSFYSFSFLPNLFFRLHMVSEFLHLFVCSPPLPPLSTGLRVEPCNETRDLSILYKHSFHFVLYTRSLFPEVGKHPALSLCLYSFI